jgi:hypothetical protein
LGYRDQGELQPGKYKAGPSLHASTFILFSIISIKSAGANLERTVLKVPGVL